jgi:hypothetical protein
VSYRAIHFHRHQSAKVAEMSFEVHLYHHFVPDTQIQSALDALSRKLDLVITNGQKLETKIMAAIDDLQAAVAAEDTVIDSAITLIKGIPALIAAAGVDPAKLTALQADITAKSQSLADAVAANTPAATP